MVTIGRSQLPDSCEIRVIQIGESPLGSFQQKISNTTHTIILQEIWTPGHELRIPGGLSEAQADLVNRHIIPLLPKFPDRRPVLTKPTFVADERWLPLLENADGQAIAVLYRPHRGAREVWYFPEEASDAMEAILRVAFTEWNTQDPRRFPSSPDWTSNVRWMSAAQHEQVLAVQAKINHASKQVEHWTSEVREAEVKLDELSGDIGQSPQRKLLMATDDDLVQAVAYAFKALGFNVVDLDEQTEEGKAKTADLSVSEDDWTAIVEVKGYTKGAKSNDLMDVIKHRRSYERRYRSDVQNMWYVANIFRNQSPESRPKIFAGADDQLSSFADPDGLAIDTRELFDLLKQVESDELSADSARAVLKNSTGRFICDTPRSSH